MSKNTSSPFLSDIEKKVCCNIPGKPEEGTPHDCIEVWKENLKVTTDLYREASSVVIGAENVYNNSFAWETKLKKWLENAKDAHLKATDAYAELDLFIQVVITLEHNTKQTSEAMQVLLCLVKRIFETIYELLQNSVSAGDAKGLLQKLKDYIECNKTLDEQKKKQALECVAAYESKVQAIYELQADILNKMVEMLHAANVLATVIGNGKSQQDFGLRWQLEDLRSRIIGQHTADKKADNCMNAPTSKAKAIVPPPCGNSILNPGSKLLPIQDSEYYSDLDGFYTTAKTNSEKYKKDMNTAREKRDKILARKNSLAEAIKAAEAAEIAK